MIRINHIIFVILLVFLISIFHKNYKLEMFENPITQQDIEKAKPILVEDKSDNPNINDTSKEIPSLNSLSMIDQQNTQNKKEEVKQNNIQIGCSSDNDCNIINGNGQNKCKSNNQCYCVSGSGVFCQNGPTNYKDPKDMTVDEIKQFKSIRNYNQMTIQDYKNWLQLYKDSFYELPDNHLKNLKKIMRGGMLETTDIPDTTHIDNFGIPLIENKLYSTRYSNNIPFLGSNYDNYNEYTGLEEIKSPEIPKNTWTTKVNPSEINKFLYGI